MQLLHFLWGSLDKACTDPQDKNMNETIKVEKWGSLKIFKNPFFVAFMAS